MFEGIVGQSSIDPRDAYNEAKGRQATLLADAAKYGKGDTSTVPTNPEGKNHFPLISRLKAGFAGIVFGVPLILSGSVQPVEAQSAYMDDGNPPVMRHDDGLGGGDVKENLGKMSPYIQSGDTLPDNPLRPVITQNP